jgi:hypothetical protein
MCLTIKLFWMKSALISFHNISVLQGALVREKSAEITLFQTRWYFGAVPFWARQSSFGLHRWAREIEPPTPPSPPARSVHRSTRDDRVVTQGVIMEGVRGPRSASGAASVASTFHNEAHSIRTKTNVSASGLGWINTRCRERSGRRCMITEAFSLKCASCLYWHLA